MLYSTLSMSAYKVHYVAGVLMWAVISTAFLYTYTLASDILYVAPFLLALFYLTTFAAVFPDVDLRYSRVRRYIARFMAVSTLVVGSIVIFTYAPMAHIIYLSIVNSTVAGLLWLVLRFFPTKHRGFTLTVRFGILEAVFFGIGAYTMLLMYTQPIEYVVWVVAAVLLGHSTHLILDKAITF